MEKMIEVFPLILLAGGRSSRMGIPKGLLDYYGHPWLVEQLKRFKAASGKRAIIVLGFHQAPYFEKIPWMEQAVQKPVEKTGLKISVVINPSSEQGQFSSLQQAVAFLQANETGFDKRRTTNNERSFTGPKIPGAFILPIDVPCPGEEVFNKLTAAFHDSIDAVIPQYQSKSGHPVLLGGYFLRRLAEIPGSSSDARLDLQIRSLPQERISFVPVDDKKICLNMNSMEIFQDFIQGEADSQKV